MDAMASDALRSTLFDAKSPASYAERLNAVCERLRASNTAAKRGENSALPDSSIEACVSWTHGALTRAGATKTSGGGNHVKALGSDAPSADELCDDEELWNAFVDARSMSSQRSNADESAIARALGRAAASGRASDATLVRAFESMSSDGGVFRSSCEKSVDVAKASMGLGAARTRLFRASMRSAARAQNARPNKPAPVNVDFEFLWGVVQRWSTCAERGDDIETQNACEWAMRAFILHPMYARAIPSLVAESSENSKRQKVRERGAEGPASTSARSSAPTFICDVVDRVARAADDMDVDALRLAPWLLRAAIEDANAINKASPEDTKALFVGLFENISHAFLAPMSSSKNRGKGRSESDATANEALTDALSGSLRVAVDKKLYSPMDDGKVENAVKLFIDGVAASAMQDDVRAEGWSRVICASTALDARLIEPHAEAMLTLLLVKSNDDDSERVAVVQTLTKTFADMRRVPDLIRSLGQVFAKANEEGKIVRDSVISEGVLQGLQQAAAAVPLAQTPELMIVCREVLIGAYDANATDDILDKLARIVQNVLGTCPDNPGEPMMPAAKECLDGFTDEITERLCDDPSPARAGVLLRAYVPVASLLRGLSEVADAAALQSYFKTDIIELSEIVKKLVRQAPNAAPPCEKAEAAAIGSAIQRVKLVSRLRYPREDVTPDEAAKAGKEIKNLLSVCFRLVPDTTGGAGYDAPDVKAEAWGVLTEAIQLWYEFASDVQIMDYYRCRLETDLQGGSLSEAEEEKFSELIVTFKPWVRAIESVILRSAGEIAQELSGATASNALCDVLEDVVTDCVRSARDPTGARDTFGRFWGAANSSLQKKGVDEKSNIVETSAVKRLRRALEAAERIQSRAVVHMNAGSFSIALQVSDCVTFTATACGMKSAMDLCVRSRSLAAFLASNDEDAASIGVSVTNSTLHYQEATVQIARTVPDAADVAKFLASTTAEFNSCLVGSALSAKASVYGRAVSLVERLLETHLIPIVDSGSVDAGAELSALLAESAFVAGAMVHSDPEREKFGWTEGNPDFVDDEAHTEITDERGEALSGYWDTTARVREHVETFLRAVENGKIAIDASSIEIVTTCVSAVGYALGISATLLDFGEKFHRTLHPGCAQLALSIATKLLLQSADAMSTHAAARLVNYIGAACDALKQTGPQLTPDAHASLVAILMTTYTNGTRVAVEREGVTNAMPSQQLCDALDLTLQELLMGTGKRPLNTLYAACMDAFKTADAESRRDHLSTDRLDVSLSAPIWVLSHLIETFYFSKAIRSAAQENVEALMDACARVLSVATTVPNASAVVEKVLGIVTEFSRLGARCEMSTRCVSRLCQLPGVACSPEAVVDDEASSTTVFSQACELMGAILKARHDHLRRAVSSVTVACSDLLAALRRLKSRDASDDVMNACASKLSYVYEAAESSGLDRYCTHLLADAITAITGGGVGPVAESALRPGLFALLDACGDRELQQLHTALGAGAGGARRVVFTALREQHKLTHKFTGRV